MASMIKVKNMCMRSRRAIRPLKPGNTVGNVDSKTDNGIGQVDVSAVNDGLQKWDVLMKRLVFNEIFVDTVKDHLIVLFTVLHVSFKAVGLEVGPYMGWVNTASMIVINPESGTAGNWWHIIRSRLRENNVARLNGVNIVVIEPIAEVVNGVEADFIANIDGLYVTVAEVVNGVDVIRHIVLRFRY
ncbi:complement resistance factor, putative [Babesia ovis]|uniref:Complement resistance factor, putative n=1 Tax=Babesia ovis TaxID=5869 RepID=A0A9W5TCC2_BABOV|nr:complement resistance factor, putative [Babesia ovis]